MSSHADSSLLYLHLFNYQQNTTEHGDINIQT